MAHIVVYLQRTPQGLHPASAVALCLARDVASQRGATVTAVCAGDAGTFDRATVTAAGRFGADIILFCGPRGLENLERRLQPAHTFVPWTTEGLAAVAGLMGGPAVPRWLEAPRPSWGTADAVTGIVAGCMPWHTFGQILEAEYEGDVDDVPLPPWLGAIEAEGGTSLPVFQPSGGGELRYVAPDGLEPSVTTALQQLGAAAADAQTIPQTGAGTFLWLNPGAGAIPEFVANRPESSRVVILPGPDGQPDPSWVAADWVLGGSWCDVLETLSKDSWNPTRG